MTQISVVGAGRPLDWYMQAWTIFSSSIANWVLMGLIFFVVIILLSFIPFLGAVAIYLLIPLFQAGMLRAAQKVDSGQGMDIQDIFFAFTDAEKRTPLMILGLIMLASLLVVMVLSVPVVGGSMMAAMEGADDSLPSIGFGAILFGLLLGVVLAMMFMFAPALILFRDMSPVDAVKASFAASWKNFLPFVVFLLIYMALAVVAVIPFGLGMLILLPLMTIAVYRAYKDLFA